MILCEQIEIKSAWCGHILSYCKSDLIRNQQVAGSSPASSSTSEQAMYRLLRLFLKVRARSRRCSSFPNRNPLTLGCDLGSPLCGGFVPLRGNIDFDRPFHKKGHDLHRVLFCGLRGPKARSTLRDFNARGGKVTPPPRFPPAVKTLVRRTRAAAQKAGWAIFLCLFGISKYRF